MVETILSNTAIQHLLIIGAYRDNEVNEVHPLMIMLQSIRSKRNVIDISLRPLDFFHVNALLSDTFHCTTEKSSSLSTLVMEKTHGNPFFVRTFLENLVHEKVVQYNILEGKWDWDIKKVLNMKITENVVDMLMIRIRLFDMEVQNVLSLAAAIGNKFDLSTLAIINKKPVKETAKTLWPVVKGNFL